MIKFARLLLLITGLGLFADNILAQSLPVGTLGIEDYYRRAQLAGKIDSNISFTVRPLYPVEQFKAASVFATEADGDSYSGKYFKYALPYNNNIGATATLLPITILQQLNSDHPYGWNDGPIIPAKGLQTYLSAGIFAKIGILSIQLQPEFVLAQNKNYDDLNTKTFGVTTARYYDFYNLIELPSRFGTSAYNNAYWGQSSIRLNYANLSFGISAENLWWGPGMYNALIMGNDAPGFRHFTFNTIKPIKSPIGSFEWQIVAGSLNNANYPPLTPTREYFSSSLYIPKPDLPRHISGLVFTWQPKWVSGLFLGFTRSSQLYNKDVEGLSDYLPFFNEFSGTSADNAVFKKKDYRSSIFARWLWPAEHAEVYFEYGHNNNYNTLADAAIAPQTNRAYTIGLRKIIPFNLARHEDLVISVEGTELGETSIEKIRNLDSWYVNKYITQGYTNNGQSLGAGIGPGGNFQTIDVSWVRGVKRLGLQVERFLHNDDLYYYLYEGSEDFRRHWVDLSIGLNGVWNYNHLIFTAKLQFVHSLNYQYYLDPALEIPGQSYFVNGITANNLHAQAGISYRF
ncbi:capsule assembly Wzi family protein [Mucilaginibacter ginkgonis]|uniref:Capsule assembly protein Wzi n=1 Tax=Mucilaginibacter ginkgonis TaxID=2682091 RepID=A0A6I4I241_9SPHI|nr:capsule assembly Wzi family protein [Mucilaginibacter ginkgonis]QQL50863.1 hypothetical protein GO620_005235 [Mucilaginibacter ginkgonis]